MALNYLNKELKGPVTKPSGHEPLATHVDKLLSGALNYNGQPIVPDSRPVFGGKEGAPRALLTKPTDKAPAMRSDLPLPFHEIVYNENARHAATLEAVGADRARANAKARRAAIEASYVPAASLMAPLYKKDVEEMERRYLARVEELHMAGLTHEEIEAATVLDRRGLRSAVLRAEHAGSGWTPAYSGALRAAGGTHSSELAERIKAQVAAQQAELDKAMGGGGGDGGGGGGGGGGADMEDDETETAPATPSTAATTPLTSPGVGAALSAARDAASAASTPPDSTARNLSSRFNALRDTLLGFQESSRSGYGSVNPTVAAAFSPNPYEAHRALVAAPDSVAASLLAPTPTSAIVSDKQGPGEAGAAASGAAASSDAAASETLRKRQRALEQLLALDKHLYPDSITPISKDYFLGHETRPTSLVKTALEIPAQGAKRWLMKRGYHAGTISR